MRYKWLKTLVIALLGTGLPVSFSCHEYGDADTDGGDGDADGDSDTDGDGDVVNLGFTIGRLELVETQVLGTFSNQASVFFFQEPREGLTCGRAIERYGTHCFIEIWEFPTCSPACGDDAICTWNESCSVGLCVSTTLEAGTISVAGGSRQVVECSVTDGYYMCDLAADSNWWDPGDTLTISAPGSFVPEFSLAVVTPPEVDVTTNTTEWTTADFGGDSNVRIEWIAGTADSVRIRVMASPNMLVCEVDDTGAFDIPAAGIAAVEVDSDAMVTLTRFNFGEQELENARIEAKVGAGIAPIMVMPGM